MTTELPDVTIRPGPRPGQPRRAPPPPPWYERFGWSRASVITSTLLLIPISPILVGVSIWITESVSNEAGAIVMVLVAALVIAAQLLACGLAVVGFVVRDRKSHLGIATFLIGLIVLAAMALLGYAALEDLP